ncbi:MAG: hypothetical protein KAT05_11960 [Spirochaetes bacterium]|nr:hypothetical protein [Spirochaetota bacterium]
MLKTIDQAFDYIYSFINLEKKEESKYISPTVYSLDNIKNIIKHFDFPYKKQKIFHIAGTKGKGSVSIIISALLNLLGYNTTNFLSPHLINPNERFLYNLNPITNKDIIHITNVIKTKLMKNNLIPTTFELFFILFLLFANKMKSDFSIIEAGLGGCLDCTNIVNPLISIITPISMDHTNILGKTISKIAYEKSGIIKHNTPIVISKQPFNCRNIFVKIAKQKSACLYDVHKYFKLISYSPKNDGIIFDFKFRNIRINDFYIPVFGKHQIYNFFTALLSVYLVNPDIIEAINNKKTLNVKIPGRIQLLQHDFPIIIDVAHNADSAKKLRDTLLLHFPNTKWNILSGMTIDKNHKSFYKELRKIAKQTIITSPSKDKKSDPKNVYIEAKSLIKNIIFIPSFEEAINKVLSMKEPTLVTGSFYIVGPFLKYFINKKNIANAN